MPSPERTALPPLPTCAAYFGPTLRLTADSTLPIVAETESGLLRAYSRACFASPARAASLMAPRAMGSSWGRRWVCPLNSWDGCGVPVDQTRPRRTGLDVVVRQGH